MDSTLIAALGIAGMFALILLHVQIGIAMAIAGVLGVSALIGWGPALSLLGTETVANLSSTDLAVVPLFLLMGSFASAGRMSTEIYSLAQAGLGHRRGGLAYATIMGCAGFGAICGSSLATTATFGRTALPEMLRHGYKTSFSCGVIAAGGNLGSIVPPSIVMVIYAILAKQFILDVFVASIIPIILTVMAMLATIAIVVRLRPDWAPLSARATWLERLGALRKAWAAGILVFVVLGGIYGGVFTVTEGASVGAIAALGIALVRRRMSLADFWKALLDAAQSTAAIYIIIIGASVFAYFVTFSGLSESFVTFLQGTGLPPLAIIFMILLGYIILGSIFETISAMLITLPFVLPLIIQLGYDPIWWGIINVAIIELGMITPPIGMNVMLLHSMTPSVPLRQIYTGVAPFILCNLLVLLVLVLVPDISLILLHWMN